MRERSPYRRALRDLGDAGFGDSEQNRRVRSEARQAPQAIDRQVRKGLPETEVRQKKRSRAYPKKSSGEDDRKLHEPGQFPAVGGGDDSRRCREETDDRHQQRQNRFTEETCHFLRKLPKSLVQV